MNKIPKFNYIKVLLLSIVTVALVIVLANIYTKKNNYDLENSDVMNFLSVVKCDDLANYLVENQNIFIYMAPSSNSSLEEFELELKDYILNEELEKDFVYLDSSAFSSNDYNILKTNYFSDELLKDDIVVDDNVTIFVVNNQKIVEVLNDNVTIESVKVLINSYGEL